MLSSCDDKGDREMRVMISFAVLLIIFSPVISQTSSNPARDVLSVDRDWASWSTRKGEEARTILNTILADDYCFTGPGGSVLTKSEYLNQISGGTSFRTEDIEVRQYGEAALVTGRTHLEFSDGVTLRRQYPVNFDFVRYTNVYVKQSGKWRLVSTQFSPVFEQVALTHNRI
jgi:ketosteroid isomerase-like protein